MTNSLKQESTNTKRKRIKFDDWVAELHDIKGRDRQKGFIVETLEDKDLLHIFGRFFFPHVIKGEHAVPDAHLDLIAELTKRRDSAIIFPRGFAKSTWEKIDCLHDIVYALEPVIVYGSESLSLASPHLEAIKMELEGNDLLIAHYGNLVPPNNQDSRKWTNTHFETTNGVNVVARGAGKGRGVNIKHQRPTKIILDDIETDEQVHSADRRRKLHDWLYNVILVSLDKERGFVKMIGTVIHPDCEVLKFYNAKGGIFRRAIEDGKSIWPNYWGLVDLIKLRDGYIDEDGNRVMGMGSSSFNQEMMNNPIDDATSIFKREWLERNIYDEVPDRQWLDVVIAVDPNAGQSQLADFMGITVLGRDKRMHKGERYVLETRQEKVHINKQVEIIKALDTKWKPRAIGIEKVMNQTALYQLASAHTDKGGGKMPIKALSPEGKDKVNRAYRVQPLIEQNVVKFNRYDTALYNELIQFPNGAHDDIADSFFYANEMLAGSGLSMTVEKTGSIMGNIMQEKF